MIDVEFKNISKTYDPGLFKKKVLAVDRLSLQVQQGEVFGLIGPNGAGKSTTIRLFLGLIRPTRGEIFFKGTPISSVRVQNDIGYFPENPYLYDHLTLDELLVFCGATSGMTTAKIQTRSNELLANLDLEVARRRPLRTFSKGMLQRAGICFALLHDPAIVVLDEPMSGLDPIGRKMVFDLVLELKSRGKTIFFCSHILNDVERLCDRIGILVGGRLVDEIKTADFGKSTRTSIVLELTACPDDLRNILIPLVDSINLTDYFYSVHLPLGILSQVISVIAAHRVEILSCRSHQVTLEDHFLRVVGEAKR